MLKYLFTVLILSLGFICFSQRPVFMLADSVHTSGCGPNSREVIRRNRVFETTEYQKRYKDGKELAAWSCKYHYDVGGKLVKQELFNKGGTRISRDSLTYDDEGKIVRGFLIDKNESVVIEWTNDNDMSITKILSKDVLEIDTVLYEYDNAKRVVKMNYLGPRTGSSRYFYDNLGRFKKVEHTDKDKQNGYTQTFEYKNSGKGWRMIIFMDGMGKSYKSVESRYNKAGQCISSISYLGDITSQLYKFNYNKDGTLNKQTVYFGNKHDKAVHKYVYFKR